uniref:Uncharacterized protein n=1 Tax=Aegilops tauschii TaxID=37682 RepID=M8C424_AEGTA
MAREMEKARKATSPKSSSTSPGPKSPARSGGSPPHKKNVTEIASKINTEEIIRRFEDKLSQKRRMTPGLCNVLPIWLGHIISRSRRPLTVPKEPSFLRLKCCIGGEFHRHFCYNSGGGAKAVN